MKTLLSSLLLVAAAAGSAHAAPVLRNPQPIRHEAVSPSDLLTGDFNGDGHADVLVVDAGRGLNVLLANGSGPFARPTITPMTANTVRLALGDVNRDGRLDAVITDGNTREVIAMLGNGDGTFTRGSSFVVPLGSPQSVAVADFNGDTLPDVATGLYDSSTSDDSLSIHFGNGAGQFSAGPLTLTPYPTSVLQPVDLDRDGNADLIAGGSFGNRLILGNGDGTFVAKGSTARGGAVVADFNHDTKPDVAVAAGGPHDEFVEVSLGNGDGTLAPPTKYVAAYDSNSIFAADVDDDGNVDLLAGGATGGAVTVLRGNADGTFDAPELFLSNSGGAEIAVGDFDRDGAEDFVTRFYGDVDLLAFVRGKGDGTFHAYRSFHTNPVVPVLYPGLSTANPRIADMNEDDVPDVVVIHQRSGTQRGPFELAVMLNDGSGKLAAPVRTSTASDSWDWDPVLDLGDLNGDGLVDAVVLSNPGYNGRAVSLLGNGDGTFDPPVAVTIASFGFPKLAHFDGDGDLDLFVPGYDTVRVYPGNGDGTFGAAVSSAVGGSTMLYGDLNGDGNMDFVSSQIRSIRAAVNDGTGHFTATSITTEELEGAALADLNGDGKLDLLINSYTGTQTRLGNGDGTFGSPVVMTMNPVPSYPFRDPIATGDFDEDGNVDVAFGTTIYLGDGTGGFRSRANYRMFGDFIAAGDLDGTGSADLAVVQRSNDDVAVLLTGTTPDPTANPTITLTASKSIAQYAENVTFEATVAGGDIPLTGAVVFSAGGRNLAILDVDADGKASFGIPFAVGSHTVTARYTGDEHYRETSSSVGVTVTKATLTLSLSGSPDPSQRGQLVRITAYWSGPSAYGFPGPTGSMVVSTGNTELGTVSMTESYGTLTTRDLPIGANVIAVSYAGDTNYEAATGSYTQDVIKPIPWIGLETNPQWSQLFAGNPVTLRAVLGSTSVTGTVAFHVDGQLLATVALSGGIAEAQTSFTWGSHSVRLVYSGDASWSPTEKTFALPVRIGPWGTPLQIVASAVNATYVTVQWSEVHGAVSYKLWRLDSLGGAWTLVGTHVGGGASFGVPANPAYLFAVSAVDANGAESARSVPDLATMVVFTDDPLVQRSTRVKARHFTELRAAINAARAFAGLAPFAYSSTPAAGQRIRRVDLTEMRTALSQARSAIGLPAISFSDGTPVLVRALHIGELRAGVR